MCINCVEYICYCGNGCSECTTVCEGCTENCENCTQNAVFVPIARESFGAKTVTTAETVLMSAIAERVVLNVQMSAKAVLKNAVTVPKWIYARNAETAETV